MFSYKRLNIPLFLFFYMTMYGAKPLKILFVVGHFPAPSQGFILNIITGLIDRGHKVTIFSLNKDPLIDVHPDIKKYNLLKVVTYKTFPKKLPCCDIVFCQFGYHGKMLASRRHLFKWLKQRKMVTCFRGSDTTSYVQQHPRIYKNLFSKGDLF